MIPAIVCDQPEDVATVETLPGFRLRVRFHDGLEGIVDMNREVHAPDAGVFAALADPSRFAAAYVEFGAVTWPGEIDLAPDAMHAEISARGVWVL
ncbi:MAG TPA: DUF2442 domain-containing protein [Caulobacteraceae bacterium]|nr:DUF2442 domain-containing protein [Caulobacteraceae bacterium]